MAFVCVCVVAAAAVLFMAFQFACCLGHRACPMPFSQEFADYIIQLVGKEK